ncbi:helix-turn-helix transcriptional regulator [Schumannella soli]|uniref:Helix-turn-helix domain-containing protein n=1 Tax=Schumannella soli TaxID=2590779 RepID=A0A506Y2B3_9MICO|nr:helix-turn-helix transcriptional regulator [Schumannella soli]TPW75587.1 helix-turn-helix domain-containing protein [Schumannella soli]
MQLDRAALAAFLRSRRSALQPEDVGLPHGRRRRTSGLRREEVAALCNMSVDYYARLERERGPQPSDQMLASIALGLHLEPAERDHLFRLGGHHPPTRDATDEHISPGMLRILDRLEDTPAEIVTELGETLRQTRLGLALTGDTASLRGPARSLGYRWFADPGSRRLYAAEDHEFLSRLFASGLRELTARRGPASRAARLAEALRAGNDEFRSLWERHEVGLQPRETKRFVHPEVGGLELACQTLADPVQGHLLLVYTAASGSDSADKLRLLEVVGSQRI